MCSTDEDREATSRPYRETHPLTAHPEPSACHPVAADRRWGESETMLPAELPNLGDGRVTLRAFVNDDVDLVRSVARDPLIPLITTVPASGSHDDALSYIARQHERLRTGAGYSFAITDQHDQCIGNIGLWLSSIHQGRASTGYWLAPAFRGRGYAKRALAILSGWAETLEDVARLELYVEPWNEASWRCAEACGFERDRVDESAQAEASPRSGGGDGA
ncbi:MAG: GNAT family N-acetyltransferase [Dermacoccus nishinomiyaensis]|nr:MAG: GNAT family N-acetyltransferase [Dermacoccus nishinomiyaensis]